MDGLAIETLRRTDGTWIVNEAIETPVVIGAGGHFCPVARFMRGGADTATPVVAKEAEFPLDGRRSNVASGVPELFFCRDLEGYAWCVRKGDYLNVGIGRRASHGFNDHVKDFAAFLERTGALTDCLRSPLAWPRVSGRRGRAPASHRRRPAARRRCRWPGVSGERRRDPARYRVGAARCRDSHRRERALHA